MGEAEAEPWHSPDVSFQPLQAGTIAVHSNMVESDGWPPPQPHAAEASTLVYYKRRLIQDRTHIVTQIHWLLKCFSCLLPDSWLCLSLFFFLFILLFPFTISSLFWGISLGRCFLASAQIIQEFGKGTRDGRERARRSEAKDFFFFFNKTNQHTNQILLPPPGSAALWDWMEYGGGETPAESTL